MTWPARSLFGSRARGNFQPGSDADIAVLLHGVPGRRVGTAALAHELIDSRAHVTALRASMSFDAIGVIWQITPYEGNPGVL
jgi:predicted nucleotidyltransferase